MNFIFGAILIIAAVVGFITGYFLGRLSAHKSSDLLQQHGLIAGLSTQIAEMKTKFEEMERSRVAIEKERERTNNEREHRISTWVESTNKIFKEMNDKSAMTADEKERRIEKWMESTKEFFEEQKRATENFLAEQGRGREEIEKKRDAQLQDMKHTVEVFTRTVSGTKTRGMVGEEVLRDVLHNSIQAGVIVTNLKIGGGEVEFAWKLDANKYIPIDAKLPDVFGLVERYNASSDPNEQKGCRKEIADKIKKEIKNIQKYQNQPNTIDNCMLVVPPAVLEIAPEIIAIGKESNVFVCTYKDVFPIAHVLEEQYLRLQEEGDIGKYKQMIKSLFNIIDKINAKTNTIKDAITQLTNANDSIREEISKGKAQKPSQKGISDSPVVDAEIEHIEVLSESETEDT